MDPVSDLIDGRCGKIGYNSSSPFEIYHILCKLESAPKHPVFGDLILPKEKGSDPFPCVIACHGSRGWVEHYEGHISNWLKAGFAVFRIHSFESRNVISIVEDQMNVTYAMMLCDSFEALKLLSTHPLINSEKIAIAGWSLGGTVALYSAWSPISEKLAPDGERFAAHLPLYPAAHIRPEEQRWEKSPIKILHGEIDDYTPLNLVQGLIDVTKEIANMEVVIYENAHHSFDSMEPLTWLPNAIKLDSRTVQIDIDGNMWGEIEEGKRIPLNEPFQRKMAFEYAMNFGAHFGGDENARNRVFDDSTNLLIGMLN
tara:strand:- start:1110 stop:2048 length:939 start_codon:yes stop_codon:yes gene_type:complete